MPLLSQTNASFIARVARLESPALLLREPHSEIATTITKIGSMQKGRSAQPVAKAVARLTSVKAYIRQATLAWLEQAGWRQDPEFLCLASHTELLGVVRALRESCSTAQKQAGQVILRIPHDFALIISCETLCWHVNIPHSNAQSMEALLYRSRRPVINGIRKNQI